MNYDLKVEVEEAELEVQRYAMEVEMATDSNEIRDVVRRAMEQAFEEGASAMYEKAIEIISSHPIEQPKEKAPWEE